MQACSCGAKNIEREIVVKFITNLIIDNFLDLKECGVSFSYVIELKIKNVN
jgi:hypothetical protein